MAVLVSLFNLALLIVVGSGWVAVRGGSRARAAASGMAALAAALMLVLVLRPNIFGMMQLAAWTVFVHVPLFLVGTAVLARRRSRWIAAISLVVALITGTIGAYACFVEPRRLEVTRITLRSGKLKRPLRIGIVADLQTDSPGKFERETLRRLMETKPDLILFPGDYLQVEPGRYSEQARRLNVIFREVGLDAPLGVYAVEGNTDPPKAWPEIFAGLPVTAWTRRTSLAAGPVTITGLSLWESFDSGFDLGGHDGYHVVFGHAPDFSLGTVDADLLVAGHTHGGQVRLPWIGPLMTFSRVPDAWASGATKLDDRRTLVVSRGIGMERGQAPRLRFLCRPELVIVDVLPGAE